MNEKEKIKSRRESARKWKQKNKEKQKIYMKEYREKNKEKIKKQNNEYMEEYTKKNQEIINARRRESYQKDKDKILKRNKKYALKNKDKIRKHHKEYSEKNKEHIKKYKKEYSKNLTTDFLSKYKLGKCCSICGYNEYPEILQFHHKNRKDKSFNISNIRKIISKQELLKKEIDKCVLICPNCHKWLHYEEGIKNK